MSDKTVPKKTGLIARKITLRVITLSVILLLMVITLIGLMLGAALQGTQGQLSRTAGVATRLFSESLGRIKTDLLATSTVLSVGEGQTRVFRHADQIFKQALEREPSFFELSLVDRRGTLLAQRRRVGGIIQPLTEQPWLPVVESGEVYIGSVSYEEYGVPFVVMAVPVKNELGSLWATLVAKVDLTALWGDLLTLRFGRTGQAYIADSDGKILIHPDLELALQGRTLYELAGKTPQEIAQAPVSFYRSALEDKKDLSLVFGISLVGVPWYVMVEQPVSEALGPFWFGFGLVALLIVGLLTFFLTTLRFVSAHILKPLQALHEGVRALSSGDMTHRIVVRDEGEFQGLAATLNAMSEQVGQGIQLLEKRITERTRDLQAAGEVSRATTLVLDPEELIAQTVEVIRERFGLYYVGLFLLDENGDYAVLRAGTGEAGRQMLAVNHRLPVGGDSMVGRCVETGEARLALDVGAEAVRFENPQLPDTHSEMALPLRARGRVIGALTVQSAQVSAFDESDIAIMQTMADQVAVAIDNVRLFAETQTALHEMEVAQQRYLAQGWTAFGQHRENLGYAKTPAGTTSLGADLMPEARIAVTEGKTVLRSQAGEAADAEEAEMVLPILLRDQPIGVLGFKGGIDRQQWDAEEVALAEVISEQFGLAAENLRLVDETQRRAALDRAVSEITARIRSQTDIESVMEQAVTELGKALKADRAIVHLSLRGQSQEEK